MAITVCIEVDDSGAISVGTEPEESSPEQGAAAGASPGMTDLAQPPEESDEPGMQPAKTIDEALAMARDMLRSATQAGGAVIGGDPGGEGAQASADAAFKSRRGYKAGM